MTKPLISVLIDTYNHEKYIEQGVVSAIEQDFPAADYEIVVVDDGSTDRTPEIVRKFAPRVRLIRKKNGGQASAFNTALPELRGDIVAFLDGDDWFAPGKIKAVTNVLEQNPDLAGAGHGYYQFDDSTGQTRAVLADRSQILNLHAPDAAREAHGAWCFLLMGALTVRRKVLEKVTPIPDALTFCADVSIVMAALAGGVRVIPEPFFYYRHHSDNFFALRDDKGEKAKRRAEMTELAFELAEPRAIELGVPRDCVAAFLYPQWVDTSRSILRNFGGKRLRTFKTEMRAFQVEHPNATLGYRLFKYLFMGSATLALRPRQFYRAREWYGQNGLGQLRERFVRSQ